MTYLGTFLPSEDKYRTEPSLIDPTLPVDWQSPDWSNEGLDYYPAYGEITPRHRAAYLIWLDRGRRDRGIPIGHAFLFFYGLERRLLVDLDCKSDHEDFAPLVAEIRELLSIYGLANKSFRWYASSLLDFIEALHPGACPSRRCMDGVRGVPFSLLRRMGEASAAGDPIPPEVALDYLRSHPDAQLGTAADRAYVEFDELFLHRYAERFGAGMVPRRPRAYLTAHYKPASEGLRSRSMSFRDVPDVGSGDAALHKLKSVSRECLYELDAYSRFLGRRPDDAKTSEAISLLPVERMEAHRPRAVAAVRDWALEALGDGCQALVVSDDLLANWSSDIDERKTHLGALARLLAQMEIGVEPDVRYGGSGLETQVVLFKCPDAGERPPPTWPDIGALLDWLAWLADAVGGGVSEEGRCAAASHFGARFDLAATELARVDAALTLRCSGASPKRPRKRPQTGDQETRSLNLQLFIEFVVRNGGVGASAVDALVQACGAFGIDEAEVYRRFLAHASDDAGPIITVRERSDLSEWAIAPSSQEDDEGQPCGVVLDLDKLQAKMADTQHVYELLGDVFASDEPEASAIRTAAAAPVGGSRTTGGTQLVVDLDDAHAQLAVLLSRQPEWAFAEAEQVAESVGLPLLSGAMDTINEATIDACGEALLEGNDPVLVNEYAVDEALH